MLFPAPASKEFDPMALEDRICEIFDKLYPILWVTYYVELASNIWAFEIQLDFEIWPIGKVLLYLSQVQWFGCFTFVLVTNVVWIVYDDSFVRKSNGYSIAAVYHHINVINDSVCTLVLIYISSHSWYHRNVIRSKLRYFRVPLSVRTCGIYQNYRLIVRHTSY